MGRLQTIDPIHVRVGSKILPPKQTYAILDDQFTNNFTTAIQISLPLCTQRNCFSGIKGSIGKTLENYPKRCTFEKLEN